MADDYVQKVTNLVARLDYATKQGRLVWSEALGDTFKVDITESMVTIGSRDGDDSHPWEMLIQDSGGYIIETISSEEFPLREEMQDLYRRARRSAKGVDRAVDAILDNLPNLPSTRSDDPWAKQPPAPYDDEPPF